MELSEIIKDIKKFIENNIVAGDVQLNPDTQLQDAGIDSFSIVEIILFIERKYGLAIPNDLLLPANFETIESIAETVQRLQK